MIGLPIRATFHLEGRRVHQIALKTAQKFTLKVEGGDEDAAHEILLWSTSYLQKCPKPFPLPLAREQLTPFRRLILQEMAQIPFGETLTYQELGERAGRPHSARAVGGACGANPFPLVVPCHRVLASGGLGGFSCGLPIKQTLLFHELGYNRADGKAKNVRREGSRVGCGS